MITTIYYVLKTNINNNNNKYNCKSNVKIKNVETLNIVAMVTHLEDGSNQLPVPMLVLAGRRHLRVADGVGDSLMFSVSLHLQPTRQD